MDKMHLVLAIALVILAEETICHRSKHSRTKNATEFDSDGKIVGGYSTNIQSVPYQVYLLLQKGNEYYQCGGSIISKRYVLTAAHCMVGIQKIYARIGSTDSQTGGTQYTTSTYKIHPLYKSNKNDYDVAVIMMNQGMNIDGTNTKVVKLPNANANVSPNTELLVSGWGATSENGDTSRNLMAVKVPTVSIEDCKKSYGSTITSRMICAGAPQGGKDSCQGDSGGPAVSNNMQLGIVSFGVGCARQGYPGVYTKVSAVRSWIKTNTGV